MTELGRSPSRPGGQDLRDGVDYEGLAAFFVAHHRGLRCYLIAQGCPDSDSDDIVQEAFLIVRQRWSTIVYYDRPKAYLYKVAIRLWYRYAAKLHRSGGRNDHEGVLQLIADPVDHYAHADLLRTLAAWFSRLPQQQRAVAGLRLIADLSVIETAEVLGVSLGTVKSQLSDARRTLTQCRDNDQEADDSQPGKEPPR
jgi:RNA polymerase sigma factor (sigma-70 family)